MLVLVLVFTTYAITTVQDVKTRQTVEDATTLALAQAKEALLAFAASDAYTNNQGRFGFLPCPDIDAAGFTAEGVSHGTCGNRYFNTIGHLPWRSLDLPPLKDGSGQCLWYAVTGDYKNSGASTSLMHNADSNGAFRLFDENGNLIQGNTEEQRVVAVVIAPGTSLPNQARNYDPNTFCGGDFNAANFLDVFNGIDNSNVSAAENTVDDFVAAQRSGRDNLNDRIITITQQEVFERIQANAGFRRLIAETTEALAGCIASYPTTAAGAGGTGGGSPPAACEICSNCYDGCDATYDCSAVPPGPGRGTCNQNRAQCRQDCRNVRNCVNNASQCPSSGGGGGGVTDNRLPWPAPMALADYRDHDNYDDADVSGAGVSNLGRLPLNVNTSDADTGNTGISEMLDRCTSINVSLSRPGLPPIAVDLSEGAADPTHRNLWEHWKDHFYYALSGAFQPDVTPPTPDDCTAPPTFDCVTTQGNAGDPYAGIVIYSDQRLAAQNQRRLADLPPETVNPPFADSKADIGNYLEGNNTIPDVDGNGDYQTATVNDIAYCIQENMTVIECP